MKKVSTLLIAILIFWTSVLSAQHLKKDGAPDMRYKENKELYSNQPSPSSINSYSTPSSTSNNYSTIHLKKDGTPDKRYKENRTSTSDATTRSSSYPKYHKTSTTVPRYNSKPNYSSVVARDANGKIKRSEAAKLSFMKQTGFPHGRPGYVIDHKIPLKEGGCDCPSNMQWQTIAEGKAKDKWE